MPKTCYRFRDIGGLKDAIIQGECVDYLKTKKRLELAKRDDTKRRLIVQLAKHILFFHSKWYEELSPETNGQTVLDKLDEAYKELKDVDNLKRIDELTLTW